jgi:hypothetical protein
MAQHGDAHVCVRHFQHARLQTFDLVSKHNANRKTGFPLEQVNRMRAGFNCREFVSLLPERVCDFEGIPVVFPCELLPPPTAVSECDSLPGLHGVGGISWSTWKQVILLTANVPFQVLVLCLEKDN